MSSATWSDGWGRWYASVPADDPEPREHAVLEIFERLCERYTTRATYPTVPNVRRVPALETPGTIVFREEW